MNILKHIWRRACGDKDYVAPIQIECRKERYGSEYGGWTICPDMITSESIVYSFGIGNDISFDIELIERFGVTVYAFDPTPKSIGWLKSQKLPEKFKAFDFGIADHDGFALFYPPQNPSHVSYSAVKKALFPQEPIKAQVYRLQTIMDKLGHDHIDLLKMDIEGFEYGVIRDIIVSPIRINQLLIEFHRWKQVGRSKTKKAIRLLNKRGFKIFEISEGGRGKEYSFIYTEW